MAALQAPLAWYANDFAERCSLASFLRCGALEHLNAAVSQGGVPAPSRALRIYAAGQMMFFSHPKRDWRGLRTRKELQYDCKLPLQTKLKEISALELAIGNGWSYVGPYYLHCTNPSHDHEFDAFYETDDWRSEGGAGEQQEVCVSEADRQSVIGAVVAQIERCDVLYARISSVRDGVSALTEIGIALGRGKRVYIDCTMEGLDTWLVRGLAARSGTSAAEYAAIPWALYK